ncbi:hypothetical protein Poly51_02950 [Rubripirellula tenax]|uniref:DUF1800 domain-containing protein n=1 Tax=Rubripirellula tenax TaxID=2528015 RepID=A0A5C6FET7_9BACT|nr:DUF1800 family protein [Rubripirellula tenax]TWU60021.1 hypothetical protein Poly51_02950 [Rubripirellula tenax]
MLRFVVAVLGLCVGLSVVSAGTFTSETYRDLRLVRQRIQAAQFLSRTTFGPTIDEIEELATRMVQVGTRQACVEWIDAQMALPPTLHQDTLNALLAEHGAANDDSDARYLGQYRYHAFYHCALRAPDQLRQRVAWALSQIFVISDIEDGFGETLKNADGNPHWYGPTNFYEKFVSGAFGNYRPLLGEVTFHPMMGNYLSHLRNAKADPANNYYPDENYAREIMQLFSIGLYELHPDGRAKNDVGGDLIPTYGMDTIQSLASVFTGLTFKGAEYFHWGEPRDYLNPMEMWDDYHETAAKELLGGTVLPAHSGAPGSGMADINATLDNLADHPNVGPFLARRLIQRLVRSNPSRGYIRRVVTAFNEGGNGNVGDIGAMIKAILIDPEAWRSTRGRSKRLPGGGGEYTVIDRGTEYSRMQEPQLHYLAMIRGLVGDMYHNDEPTSYAIMPRMQWDLAQSPFGSPNVFNFYLPDYQPPGPLATVVPSRRLAENRITAPEFTLLTPVLNNRMGNRYKWDLYQGEAKYWMWEPVIPTRTSRLVFDYSQMLIDVDADREGLLERLDLQFCRGTMPDETRQDILDAVESISIELEYTDAMDRLTAMLYLVISSPDCWVLP